MRRQLMGGFIGAGAALSAAVACLVGIRGVAVLDVPRGVRGLLTLPPAPSSSLSLAWTRDVIQAAEFQKVGVQRITWVVVLLLLTSMVVALLNIFVLLFEAGLSRHRDLAVRAAVGAPPHALVVLLLRDVRRLVLLSMPVGLLLGVCIAALVRATWPGALVRAEALGGEGALAAALALLAAVAPVAYVAGAVVVSRASHLPTILRVGERSTDDPAAAFRRRVLSAAQMGVAGSVAVAGASLALATRLPDIEGSAADIQVVAVSTPRSPTRAPTATLKSSGVGWQPLLARIRGIPGVTAESLATPGALVGLTVRDYAGADCGDCTRGYLPTRFLGTIADQYAVGPGYFDLTGTRLLHGRTFSASDGPHSPRVAIVSQSFEDAVFDHGALGRTVRVGRDVDTWYTVVGVVADRSPLSVGRDDQPKPQVYLNAVQVPPRKVDLIIQGTREARAAVLMLLDQGGYDPADPRSLSDVYREAAAPVAWLGWVAALLALLTLMLGLHGCHAAVLQLARRRRRELAVRRALGATEGRLMGFVLLGSARQAVWGAMLASMLGTLWVGLLRQASGAIPPPSVGTYAVVTVLLVGTSLLASVVAVREAMAGAPWSAMA